MKALPPQVPLTLVALSLLPLLTGCEADAARSDQPAHTQTTQTQTTSSPQKSSASQAATQKAAQGRAAKPPLAAASLARVATAPLPDNPLEALAHLTPEALGSLRQALLARDTAGLTEPTLKRLLAYVLPFLESHYAAMLSPGNQAIKQAIPAARLVKLPSHDGLSLKAAFVRAKKPTQQAVIVLHGYGSNPVYAWTKYSMLHERYNLLLLSGRGHDGQPGEISLGVHEARDLQHAIEWLSRQGQTSFALVGESLGAAVAISGGSIWANGPGQQRFPLKGVWSDAAYADLGHAISERADKRLSFEAPGLGYAERGDLAKMISEVFLAWLAQDTGVADAEAAAAPRQYLPALLRQAAYAQVHSRQDEETSYANAELLESTARGVTGAEASFWATYGDHVDSWRQKDYTPRLKDFLSKAFARP